jgi:hypothetical protein
MPFFNENGGTPYGSASGDKAGEFDGDNYRPDNTLQNDNVNVRARVDLAVTDPTCTPFPQPAFYNMTVIGTTPSAPQFFTPTSAAGTNRGIQWRNGGAGLVANSIITNTGAETGIEIDTGLTGCPGFNSIDNANNGYTQLMCSTLANGAAPAAQETTVINNGNALNLALGGSAAGANVVNNAAFANLVNRDQTFNPVGVAGHLSAALKPTPINPRPAAGFVGVAGCTGPSGPVADRTATYRGAFSASAPTLWTTGWTALNVGGLLAN